MYDGFMTISDGDLSKIGRLMTVNIGEALEQVVFPKLLEIEEKMATKDDLKKLEAKLDAKIDGVEERLAKRIDKVAGTVTDMKTNHERRIRKLENVAGVVPEVRLTL